MSDYKSSNGLHKSAWNNDQLEPITDFDYSAVSKALDEPDDDTDDFAADQKIAWADCVAGWTLLLEFITKPESMALAGANAHMLVHCLNPESCRYRSLREIAAVAGVTRACLSKHLMAFRKQIGLHFGLGKAKHASEVYSQAQHASYATGNHSSFTRTDRRGVSGVVALKESIPINGTPSP